MPKDNKMTIEKLATMVANGFKDMATKDDIKGLKSDLLNTKNELVAVIEHVKDEVSTLEEVDIRNLHHRVFNLEKDFKIFKRKNV